MAFTYTPCPECRTLNRVSMGSTAGKPICGKCKIELPLEGSINLLSASNLTLLIEKSPIPIVAYFWAPWCQPCKIFGPVFAQVSQSLSGQVIFAKVDLQANPLAQDTFYIRGIPSLILFRDGIEQARQSGAMPPEVFTHWILEHLRAKAA